MRMALVLGLVLGLGGLTVAVAEEAATGPGAAVVEAGLPALPGAEAVGGEREAEGWVMREYVWRGAEVGKMLEGWGKELAAAGWRVENQVTRGDGVWVVLVKGDRTATVAVSAAGEGVWSVGIREVRIEK